MSAVVTVTAPATSSCMSLAGPRSAGSSRRVATTTATPIGRLTRKIQCQSSTSVRTPPSTTPTLPPPEATKPMTPIAFARSAGSVKSVMTSDSATTATTAPPSPWIGAGGDEELLRLGGAAGQRRDREEHEADEEELAMAEEVAEPPAEQQEAAERQQVGVDDPRQRRLAEAEVLADRGQGDVHDRRVEDDHEIARAEHDQREPAGAVVHLHGGFILSRSGRFEGSARTLAGAHARAPSAFGLRTAPAPETHRRVRIFPARDSSSARDDRHVKRRAELLDDREAAQREHRAQRRRRDAPVPRAEALAGGGRGLGVRVLVAARRDDAGVAPARRLGDRLGREQQRVAGELAQALERQQRVRGVVEDARAPDDVVARRSRRSSPARGRRPGRSGPSSRAARPPPRTARSAS